MFIGNSIGYINPHKIEEDKYKERKNECQYDQEG